MAGHSQFKNIMHRKGKQDAQKSKLFGKLAREITVAAKLGTPDPVMNPRLRAAVIAARSQRPSLHSTTSRRRNQTNPSRPTTATSAIKTMLTAEAMP